MDPHSHVMWTPCTHGHMLTRTTWTHTCTHTHMDTCSHRHRLIPHRHTCTCHRDTHISQIHMWTPQGNTPHTCSHAAQTCHIHKLTVHRHTHTCVLTQTHTPHGCSAQTQWTHMLTQAHRHIERGVQQGAQGLFRDTRPVRGLQSPGAPMANPKVPKVPRWSPHGGLPVQGVPWCGALHVPVAGPCL